MSTSVSDTVSDPVAAPAEAVATAPSAQADRFVHDRLPSPQELPRMVYAMPELRIPAQANLVQALFAKAIREGHADKPMLRSDKITLSYADALERVNRIAQVLTEDFKLQPGNRVLLRGGNSIGMALAWLGVVQAGLVAVATMPLLRAKELGEVIEKARPALALCDASLAGRAANRKAQSATLPVIVPFNLMDEPGSLAVSQRRKTASSRPARWRRTTLP
jgi:2-aminobenzoate-CoA ligase